MLFKTIEEYDKELNEMKQEIAETEKYLETHPEKLGTKGNFETMKYLFELFSEDRINFIKEINKFNLKMSGITSALPAETVTNLNLKINETTNSTTILFENTHPQENLLINKISEGSYKITYSFENPTEEDVKRTSARKKGLIKLFDFIKCGDDIDKLIKEAGPNGEKALCSYKSFLKEIAKLNTDFTLDAEMGTVKAGLTLKECENICEKLNI